jgi:hypothetical protein
MRGALSLLALASVVTGGCASRPPAAWASGGSRLELADATWKFGDDAVTMDRSGHVTGGSVPSFSIDAVGRVYDEDGDPAALLLRDGNVVGNDDAHLGRVGVTNASPPGAEAAWLSVSPDGNVVLFEPDGERHSGGGWTGCGGPVLRTCTFITHLVALERAASLEQSRVSVGIGVGVGIYR